MGPMDVYTDQEADRLSRIMVDDPHFAANELRGQLQQLDPQTASVLIAKTKNDEFVGGLGDLQIQVQFDQNGYDSGYRNVTMATQYGVEQIAELQAQPPAYAQPGYNPGYAPNPLGFVAGVIVGDLLWQQNHGMRFDDDRYRGWCNREQEREQYWNQNNGQFAQNWANPNFRNQYQDQSWAQSAYHPTQNNTYVTNNRIDNTVINRPVNTTIINETINNTRNVSQHTNETFNRTIVNNPHQPIVNPAAPAGNTGRPPFNGQPQHRETAPPITGAPAGNNERQPIRQGGAGAGQFNPGLGQNRNPAETARPVEKTPAANPGAPWQQTHPQGGTERTGQPARETVNPAANPAATQNRGESRQPAANFNRVETRQPAAAAPHVEIQRTPPAPAAAQHVETARPQAPAASAPHEEQKQPEVKKKP